MPTRGRGAASPDVVVGDIEPQIVASGWDKRQLKLRVRAEGSSGAKGGRRRQRRIQAKIGAVKKAGKLAQTGRELARRKSPQRDVAGFAARAWRLAIQAEVRIAPSHPLGRIRNIAD